MSIQPRLHGFLQTDMIFHWINSLFMAGQKTELTFAQVIIPGQERKISFYWITH